MLEAGDGACTMEASSIAIAQGRLDAARFAAVGFTNLSQDHLDFHGDMEGYFAAKAELFDGRCPRVTNADDAMAGGSTPSCATPSRRSADVAVEARRARPGRDATCERRRAAGSKLEPRLRGRFNVDNVLCATALALLLDLPDEAIAAGVAAMPGRARPLRGRGRGQPFAVIVDYAHTPGGIEAVLALGAAPGPRAGVLRRSAPAATATGPSARSWAGRRGRAGPGLRHQGQPRARSRPSAIIARGRRRGSPTRPPPSSSPTGGRAIARALRDAGPGTWCVIAGKGHEQGQDIGGVVHPFDDRSVARSCSPAAARDPARGGRGRGREARSAGTATRIEQVVIDSRAAGPGALFVRAQGERTDGHDSSTAAARGRRARRRLPSPAARPDSAGSAVLEAD